jgi:hypothetical protein
MVPSSGWGLWGEVGGTDLAAPAPTHTGAGADALSSAVSCSLGSVTPAVVASV